MKIAAPCVVSLSWTLSDAQGGLIDDIRARRFSAIMLPVNVANHRSDSTGRWTPEVLDAVREHYRLAFRDSIFTYVPK